MIGVIKREWRLLNETDSTASEDIKAAVSKIAGFVGKFGETRMFKRALKTRLEVPIP